MRPFLTVIDLAAGFHGGRDKALETSTNVHAVADLATVPDDRFLATMARCVFNAGFNWRVIDAKWDGFEAAFEGFEPARLAFFGEDRLDTLVSDKRIVRHGAKIKATLANARFVADTSKASGGFGAYLAAWPADDQVGLLAELGRKGARLGGATGQYVLRFSGWDGWITSPDVCTALHREGVLDKPQATSKTALKAVQSAINRYHEESGLPRAQISRLLAMSIG